MLAQAVVCPACRATIRVTVAPGAAVATCPECGGRFPLDSGATEQTSPSPSSAFPETASIVAGSRGDLTDETLAGPSGPPPSAEFPFLAPPQRPDEIGRLGPYRVLGVLGAGGMGVVFRAEDPALRRQLALKVMLPQFASHPTAKARFLREARSQAAVEHPHVIAIYQVAEVGDVALITMPLLKGQTLGDALRANPHVPVGEAVRIAREVAEGLAAAHEQGLVHRDIKPANIWLEGKRLGVKVLDFGLARAESDGDGGDAVTQQGAIVGTPAYMSPEQATGEPVDARTDLFSLGVVLYQMLAGRPPFAGKNTPAILVSVTTHHPPRPADLNPQVPADLDALTMRLLAKDPGHRPASAEAAADALRAVGAGMNQTLPVPVMYAPAATAADPWECIADTEPDHSFASVAASAVRGEPTPTEEAPVPRPARGKRGPVLLVAALLALAGTVAVAAGVIMNTGKKDGTVAEVQVPDGAAVPVEKGTKKVAAVGPATWQPGPEWKPVPAGQSPFDTLDAKEIPAAERFGWQPRELVAVIGTHARRHWGPVFSAAISADGKLAATRAACRGDSLIIWDAATGAAKWRLTEGDYHNGSLHFTPDGRRLVCSIGSRLAVYDLSGPEPVATVHTLPNRPDGKGWNGVFSTVLCEGGRALVAISHDDPIGLFDLTDGTPRLVQVKERAKETPVLVAGDANQVVYTAPDGKLRRATVKGAKFAGDEELPIKLAEKDYPSGISPDGKRLAILGDNHLQLWDVGQKPPKLVHRINENAGGWLTFSADGRWMERTNTDTALFRIDGAEPKFAGWRDQTSYPVFGRVAFSADGNRAVVANGDGFARFWDLTGTEPKEIAPFDPAAAFPTNPVLDAKAGRALLPRYGPERRSQLWDLTGPRPGLAAGPDVFLATGSHFPSAVGGGRWLACVPNDRLQLFGLAGGKWEPASEPFGPGVWGAGAGDGMTVAVLRAPAGGADVWDVGARPPAKK